MRRLLVAAVLPVLILAAPAAARVRLVGATQLGHPTLLGSRVLYERQGAASDGGASYILESLGPGGRSTLVSAPTAVVHNGGIAHTTAYAYAASATNLALAELDGSNRGSQRLGSVTLSFSALDQSATETIATCDQPVAPHPPPFAVEGPRIAFVEGACEGTAESVVVHEIGGADVRIAVPAGDTVSAVALAGDYVAYDLEPPPGGGGPAVVVASRVTGAESFRVGGTGGPFALQPDGTLAAVALSCPDTTLLVASPAAPAPQIVAGAHPCSPLRLGGGRVVYRDTAGHLHVAGLAAGDKTLVDAAVGDFDADAQRAVYTFPDCAGRALFRVGLDEAPSAPAAPSRCPVRVRQRALRLRGTHVVVPLACPQACRGQISLTRGGRLASTSFTVPDPGNGTAALQLSSGARRRVGRGRLPATLVIRTTLPAAGRSSTQRVGVTVRR
ncbi:MAG: hypothetical protein JWN32_685 [Solirubrobacterales bacterium]|nr:hypothetical protein [Solirubrobacterales bacterium]